MRRTYWHLQESGRMPSSYEIATSRLLYYPARGFEVQTPGARWIERFQKASPLVASYASFADPRATTYASYVALQKEQESFVDGMLRGMEESDYDRGLREDWLETLERVLPVLRFPCHGLQMLAAYVGSMAPEGRVVVAASFQAADEMRRIQRVAYRMHQLREVRTAFGQDARSAWQEHAAWQPLRAVIEKLLVTYDFGEAFVALSLVLKPAFDELFMVQFAEQAIASGDRLLAEIFRSLAQDCRWHRHWAHAALESAIAERAENLQIAREWVASWWARVQPALPPLLALWSLPPGMAREACTRIEDSCRAQWSKLGLVDVESRDIRPSSIRGATPGEE